MSDRTYIQIPGDRTHELPPLLIHGDAATNATQVEDVVDLAADITDTRDAATRYLQPSVLLQRRLMGQNSVAARSANGPDLIAARVAGAAALPAPGRSRLPVYREEP